MNWSCLCGEKWQSPQYAGEGVPQCHRCKEPMTRDGEAVVIAKEQEPSDELRRLNEAERIYRSKL